jgi:hypothetical protein
MKVNNMTSYSQCFAEHSGQVNEHEWEGIRK